MKLVGERTNIESADVELRSWTRIEMNVTREKNEEEKIRFRIEAARFLVRRDQKECYSTATMYTVIFLHTAIWPPYLRTV